MRLLIFVVLAVAFWAPALAQQQEKAANKGASQTTQNENAAESGVTKPATVHFAPGSKIDASTYRTICDYPKDKDHADLCQQWRVAESARSQEIINIIGLMLIGTTVVFTAIAAVATRKMWKVGIRQARLTDRNFRLSQRARVSVEPAGIESNTNDELIGQVVFRNTGHMPASEFKWRIKIVAYGGGDWQTEITESSELEGNAVLPVGAQWDMGTGRCKPEPEMPTDYIYVYGRVEYLDGFNKPRHTNFCHRYPWARIGPGGVVNIPGGGSRIERKIGVGFGRFHKNGNEAD